MAKKIKILNGNIVLLLLVLLLGCTNESNKEAKIIHPKENSTTVAEATSEKDDSKTDYSNDVSSKNKQNENDTSNKSDTSAENQQNRANSWNTNDMTEEETTKEETDEELLKNDTNNIQSEPQKDITDPKEQNGNQANQIHTNTDINDQEWAISLVKDYLRDRNELIEDENHFVLYDGEVNNYIIVRYSTLLSGHSSTNGRYGVNIESGKIKDINELIF